MTVVKLIANILQERLPASPGDVRQLTQRMTIATADGVFSTDPPYYDNVPYADLSDFFYVWLRRCLQQIYPHLLSTVLVPKAEELVADPFRHGGKDEARSILRERAWDAFRADARGKRSAVFPTTIYYAFKQAEEETIDDAARIERFACFHRLGDDACRAWWMRVGRLMALGRCEPRWATRREHGEQRPRFLDCSGLPAATERRGCCVAPRFPGRV